MCIPVSPKKVAANWGTVLDTLANSDATSWCGTAGKMGMRRPSAIRLLHSLAWRTIKPMPHAIVAKSQRVRQQEQPHPDFFRIRAKQRRLIDCRGVDLRDVVRQGSFRHAFGLLV